MHNAYIRSDSYTYTRARIYVRVRLLHVRAPTPQHGRARTSDAWEISLADFLSCLAVFFAEVLRRFAEIRTYD